jgi:predicted aspartyl protease
MPIYTSNKHLFGDLGMRYINILPLLLAVYIGPWSVLAAKSTPQLHYEAHTKAIIPENIEMPDQVSIPAVVGDVYLQSPIINIKINGQGPFLFMFDTGFTETVISRSLAQKLKLPIIETLNKKVATPTQLVNVFEDTLMAEKIEIGDIVIKNYGLSSSSVYEDDITQFENLKIDGILSASIFYGMLITLDYKHEQIHVQKGNLSADDGDVISCRKNSIVPVIQGKIKFDKLKKEEMQDFLIDTGDSAYVYVSTCKIPEMKKFKNQEILLTGDMYDKAHQTSLAELYGEIILSKSVILKSPLITFSGLHCHQPLGRLGRKFFETHKVTLDKKNNLIQIKRY